MTVSARTTFTAPKRKTALVAITADGEEIKARQNAKEVRIDFPRSSWPQSAYIEYGFIEATIELLFAVKADREAQAAFERKWLADHAGAAASVQRLVETLGSDPLDIIAVDEPTA